MNEKSSESDSLGFVSALRRRGVQLRVDAGDLVCSAPKGTLTPQLRTELGRRKAEILALLLRATTPERDGIRVGPRSIEGDPPLSFSQQRLWFLEELEPGKTAYNLPLAFRLKGSLDVAALSRALDSVVQRHEVLRATYVSREGVPHQVTRPLRLQLSQLDLSRHPAQAQRLHRFLGDEARRPFDLARGPLVRAALAKLGPADHVLCFVAHHSVFDGSSEPLLVRELTALYGAFTRGEPAGLPELPVQYADFACWEREWLEGDWLNGQIEYWSQKLEGVPALELPTDHPRPALQSYVGATEPLALPAELTERLLQLARGERATLFMLMSAAFKTLLHRHSGQCDIAVGTPINNRNSVETEHLFGFFVNMLVLRTPLNGQLSFRGLLALERQTCLEAYDHQDVPFERLVEELNPERDLSRTPLYQAILGYVDFRNWAETSAGADLVWERLHCPTDSSRTDLTLWIEHTDEALTGYLEYSTDLFDGATIRRMLGHFQTLLEGIADDPDRPIGRLPLLDSSERRLVLETWNDTRRDYPRERTAHELFELQAERTPDRVAAVFPDASGGAPEELRYAELDARANRLARHLRDRGVGPGDIVGLHLEPSPQMLVGLFGVLKAGASYLPLDPTFPAERLRWMLEDSEARLVLSLEGQRASLPETDAALVCLDSDWEALARESDERIEPARDPAAIAYLIYTSGSTGRPKGVEIPHRALVNFLASMAARPGLSGRDVLLSVTTLSFDIAVLELLLPLVCGGRVVVASRDDARDGSRLARLLDDFCVNVMQATPATWRLLLEAGWEGRQGLRILCGGEAMPRDLAKALLGRCGELWNMYGPSETTVWSTVQRIGAPEESRLIGRPIGNTQAFILDDELQPAAIGAVGELCIGGDGLARGYLKRPELTRERFVANPFDPSGRSRLYRTGDRARYRKDGRIEFLGRLDHQLKLRGHRIEPGEIEAALCQHPRIEQAVVVVGDDPQGAPRLLAYYVARDAVEIPAEELRGLLKRSLPLYMVPALFLRLDALPLTPNRKVDRAALPAPQDQPAAAEPLGTPRDALEARLAELWAEMLGLSEVGVGQNFFDIGGYSLLVTRMVARIRSELGVELPIGKVFELPTVEQLALHIKALRLMPSPGSSSRASASRPHSLVEIQPRGSRTPLFGIHSTRYRTLSTHLGAEQPLYSVRYGLARSLPTGSALPDRLEELAAHYIEEMRQVQARGPYQLMGLCMGGIIAIEMAQQLLEQGEQVRLLAIFDALAPGGRIGLPLTGTVRNLLRIGPGDALQRVQGRMRARFPEAGSETGHGSARHTYRGHVPRAYDGNLDLFRPADRTSLVHRFAEDLGWGALVRGRLRVHAVPGADHQAMFREPRVRQVARKLEALLEPADPRPEEAPEKPGGHQEPAGPLGTRGDRDTSADGARTHSR